MSATNQTPATQASLKDQIREFIQVQLAEPKGIASFTDDESLMESGVIDSLGIFRLVSFLEEDLRVRVSDEEINAETLKSVNAIEELVIRKRSKYGWRTAACPGSRSAAWQGGRSVSRAKREKTW